MAIPTFTNDMTTITTADSTTGWVAIGGAMIAAGSDILKEGTNSIFVEAKSVALQGTAFDLGSGNEVDLSVELLYIWVNVISRGLVNTLANGGVRIFLGSGTVVTANFGEFYVGGSDTLWVEEGWRLIVLDANRTPDATNGTFTKTAVRFIGVEADWVATVGKAPSLNIDIMRRGTKMEVTGPSHTGASDLDFNDNGAGADTIVRAAGSWITDGFEAGDTIVVSSTTSNNKEFVIVSLVALTLTLATGVIVDEQNTSGLVMAFVTFQDIIDKDVADDTEFGMITSQKAEVFEINYPLIFGDESGSLDMAFLSRGESIVFTDQPLDATKHELKVLEDTGVTKFVFGQSSGSGDAKVGFGGSTLSSIQTDFGTDAEPILDLSDSLDTLQLYGSIFKKITQGINFSAVTISDKNEIYDCIFDNCGQVDLNRAKGRNSLFSGYTLSADGALLWNDNIDIINSKFLANTGTAASGIEHPGSAGSPYSYTNLTFAANDNDVNNTSGSGITISNLSGSNATTSKGSSVTFESAVSVVVSGVSEGTAVKLIAEETVGSVTVGDVLQEDLANSAGETAYAHTYEGDLDILVRARASGLPNAAIADDNGVFTDETTAANSTTTADMNLLPGTPVVNEDRYQIGHSEKFGGLLMGVSTAGTGGFTITWEYWDGGSWTALSGVTDNTSSFSVLGENKVTWTIPGDWATRTDNSQGPFFYVRAAYTAGTVTVTPIGRKCSLNVTRYLPFTQSRTITSTGLDVVATWIQDTIATF